MAIVSQPGRSLEVGGAGCALIYSWLSCQGWFVYVLLCKVDHSSLLVPLVGPFSYGGGTG